MNLAKKVSAALLLILLVAALSVPTFAAGEGQESAQPTATAQAQEEDGDTGMKAIALGLAIGLAAAGGGIGMGIVGGKAADGISRQPVAEGKIRTTLMLDLVFIETAIIYALLVVILIIFVL